MSSSPDLLRRIITPVPFPLQLAASGPYATRPSSASLRRPRRPGIQLRRHIDRQRRLVDAAARVGRGSSGQQVRRWASVATSPAQAKPESLSCSAPEARSLHAAGQALQALFSTGTAAAVAGGEAAAAAPLLRAAARLPATPVGLRALLPAAARVSCSGGACWRPAAGPGSAAVVGAAAGRRGYATMGTKAPKSGYKPPPEMQRAMQMRLSMVSSNLLAEPFRGVPPSQPVTAYFTIGGWKQVGGWLAGVGGC